ncbi:TIGR03936 family radical SAM-associated protein [Actinokineospora sp. PR83]|uniref:TIGR03936 family radical SAM-associated protein n=1 Tax=Actinokineospora sp. PR83 TaxID=2884908 RepID=UPI0027E039B3|nr:TIGR03936 family radical SAM-associated protein [Actinokineospora sp. PR83]MCG8917059.1 TIGR03936 family radical SAM-associated protein [Actinokineospora sp. PR83]
MQKLRLRYAKRGRLRFTSHRDVARAFERALRRAGVPMAYSQGFNPHPKISWIGAAPTGVASEAEYVELQVVQALDPDRLARVLDAALAPGLDVLEAVQAGPGGLAERMEASRWRIALPGVGAPELAAAVDRLMATEHVEVERLTKDGRRLIDARPAVISAEVVDSAELPADSPDAVGIDMSDAGGSCGILVVVVRQTTPAVRPDDVLSALRVVAALEPPVPAKATRMAQGRLDDGGGLTDPLAHDRAAIG